MSSIEKEQRNRVRNLAGARDALASGDPQSAANSLAHAVAAQRALDGPTHPPVGDPATPDVPYRDFVVDPGDIDAARDQITRGNITRMRNGQSPLRVEVSRQRRATPDPLIVWEQATLRVSGASDEDLHKIAVEKVSTKAVRRARTEDVLAAACASVRQSNGRYQSVHTGPNSTPAQVTRCITEGPRGGMRNALAPTPADRAKAREVLKWARAQQPTTEYLRALRHSVSDDHMNLRDVGTAASALAGYQRHLEREAELDRVERESGKPKPTVPGTRTPEPRVMSPRPHGSRFLNQPGDKVRVVADVEQVTPIEYPGRPHPHYLYVMRTPDGDLVRWVASETAGLRKGDRITLQGTVKSHSVFRGEKQTEMHYCTPRMHTPA